MLGFWKPYRRWLLSLCTIGLAPFLFGIVLSDQSHAKSLEEETPVLVKALAKQLVAKKKPKIAALDFADIQGRPNELGRFLAEQLSVDMVLADGITVIDRANISAIMAEHQLTAEGLVNPENAKKLGHFAGVDAILIGNLAVMENLVVLTVKAISTETAEVVAAGRMRFDLSKDVQRMLGLSVSTSARGTSSSMVATAPGPGAVAATPVSVGPVVATVKNISYGLVGEGAGRYPQIRVTLEFENRNLNASVAITANAQVLPAGQDTVAPTTGLIFGALQDSSGAQWLLAQGSLRGIPIIYCFESEGHSYSTANRSLPYRVTQNSPSNVVDYIRRGVVEYDGSGLKNETRRLWAGSFASIEPGGRLEATAIFVSSQTLKRSSARSVQSYTPEAFLGAQGQQAQSARSVQSYTPPESFELSLELVLATHQAGERPEKARDLALRTLVINRLVLPQAAAGGR